MPSKFSLKEKKKDSLTFLQKIRDSIGLFVLIHSMGAAFMIERKKKKERAFIWTDWDMHNKINYTKINYQFIQKCQRGAVDIIRHVPSIGNNFAR